MQIDGDKEEYMTTSGYYNEKNNNDSKLFFNYLLLMARTIVFKLLELVLKDGIGFCFLSVCEQLECPVVKR